MNNEKLNNQKLMDELKALGYQVRSIWTDNDGEFGNPSITIEFRKPHKIDNSSTIEPKKQSVKKVSVIEKVQQALAKKPEKKHKRVVSNYLDD